MMKDRICTICGAAYTPTAYNQLRCPSCVRDRKLKCALCGAVYTTSLYNRPNNRSMCDACLFKYRAEMNSHALHIQSDEARKRTANERASLGKKYIESARMAGKTHPHTAKGSEKNTSAKIWLLRAPDGTGYEVSNLYEFLRQHEDWFPFFNQARKAFTAMGRTIRDPDGDFPHRYSYYGWTLDAPPFLSDEMEERKKYIAQKETLRKKRRALNEPGYINNVEEDEE